MKKSTRTAFIIAGSLTGLAVIGLAIYLLFGHQQTAQPAPTTEETAAQRAAEAVESGAKNEAEGNTDAALGNYEAALKDYQTAGDQAGQESMRIQIEYMKKAQKLEQSLKDGTYKGPEELGSDPE